MSIDDLLADLVERSDGSGIIDGPMSTPRRKDTDAHDLQLRHVSRELASIPLPQPLAVLADADRGLVELEVDLLDRRRAVGGKEAQVRSEGVDVGPGGDVGALGQELLS